MMEKKKLLCPWKLKSSSPKEYWVRKDLTGFDVAEITGLPTEHVERHGFLWLKKRNVIIIHWMWRIRYDDSALTFQTFGYNFKLAHAMSYVDKILSGNGFQFITNKLAIMA